MIKDQDLSFMKESAEIYREHVIRESGFALPYLKYVMTEIEEKAKEGHVYRDFPKHVIINNSRCILSERDVNEVVIILREYGYKAEFLHRHAGIRIKWGPKSLWARMKERFKKKVRAERD